MSRHLLDHCSDLYCIQEKKLNPIPINTSVKCKCKVVCFFYKRFLLLILNRQFSCALDQRSFLCFFGKIKQT